MKKIFILLSMAFLSTNSFATCFDNMKIDEQYSKVNIPKNNILFQQEKNKIQITEFFWYGCPHCFHMEPLLVKFLKDNPNVDFKRYPLAFPNWKSGAAFYFAENNLKLTSTLHDKVFKEIHDNKKDILNNKQLREQFLKSNNVDVKAFEDQLASFTVNMEVKKSEQVAKNYELFSAPTFIINNTYVVTPALSKSYENVINHMNIINKSLNDKSCKAK